MKNKKIILLLFCFGLMSQQTQTFQWIRDKINAVVNPDAHTHEAMYSGSPKPSFQKIKKDIRGVEQEMDATMNNTRKIRARFTATYERCGRKHDPRERATCFKSAKNILDEHEAEVERFKNIGKQLEDIAQQLE